MAKGDSGRRTEEVTNELLDIRGRRTSRRPKGVVMGQGVSDPSLDLETSRSQTWRHPGGKLVEEGVQTLKQDELLAVLIGSGVPGRPALAIANAILDEYVGLYGIHQGATVKALVTIRGLGLRKAERILAAIELGRRLHRILHRAKSPPSAQAELFSTVEQPPESGPNGPSDVELLGKIIGSGIRGRTARLIADELLTRFGSFLELFGQDMGKFLGVKGLNSVRIIRIAAALEIAKRLAHALS